MRRRDVKPRVHRGGLYPLVRAWTTVIQRDLAVTSLLSDVYAGRPVGYSTFVGYDEIAHHSGIERPETLHALEQLDQQFRRLELATRDAPRPYELVVLSDDGQTDGTPFRQRSGESLEELVDGLTDEASVEASGQGDEGGRCSARPSPRRPPPTAGRPRRCARRPTASATRARSRWARRPSGGAGSCGAGARPRPSPRS